MKTIMLAALLGAVAAPATAQEFKPAKPPAANSADAKARPDANKKGGDFDMAKMMAMFDKIFPAQPDPAHADPTHQDPSE